MPCRSILLCALLIIAGSGQAATVLQVEVANYVFYVPDGSPQALWYTQPQVTQTPPFGAFSYFVGIGDIVAINGKPARGTYIQRAVGINSAPSPTAGQLIADVARGNLSDILFDLETADGRLVGSIMGVGFLATTPPPGAPTFATQFTAAVTGGTGAFQGVRGQISAGANPAPGRGASVTEDPTLRRTLGGGGRLFLFQFTASALPQVAVTSAGPAVFHADFTPVNAQSPAHPGEVLIATAVNLGPTRPGVDDGQTFPQSPLQEVNSPVEVSVDGVIAEAINKVGLPGTQDRYRVDFRIPSGAKSGPVAVQLTAAWITGPPVTIPIQ